MWFGYDPLGRCVKRWVGPSGEANSNPATYLYYDGWNLIQEGPAAWTPSRLYAQGNRVDEIAATFNAGTGEFAYHHYDARGHCTLLTGSGGAIVEQYEYDAFGLPYFYDAGGQNTGSSAFGNRFLFTGREWLSDLHLYDYRHRLYQPELGRFLQPDPKHFEAGDYNLYRYCHNDPVNKSDPMGLDVENKAAVPIFVLRDGDWIQASPGQTVTGRTDAFSGGKDSSTGRAEAFKMTDPYNATVTSKPTADNNSVRLIPKLQHVGKANLETGKADQKTREIVAGSRLLSRIAQFLKGGWVDAKKTFGTEPPPTPGPDEPKSKDK